MVGEAAIQEFGKRLRGELVRPGEGAYDEARKVFNAMIDKHPAMIARCAGAADVIHCVRFAREHDLEVAVRGSGHNVAGTAVCDGGLVIDLTPMKNIRVNPVERSAQVGGGCTWAEVNHDLQVFDLAATGGYIGTTGVAGLTLGGGLGWMVRKHGLALDNLLSADVVTADGRLLTASAGENGELFWGLRGGGGNFGIVTSFEFRVHPAGMVWAGVVMHPLSKGREVLQYWREFETTAPEELTTAVFIFHAPPELPVPDELRREPIVAIAGVYTGSLDAGEQVLHPLRQFGPPTADTFQQMPYDAAQTFSDWAWPPGFLNYWKSSFLKGLSDSAIDTLLSFYARVPSRRTIVVLEHNGDGAMSRVPVDATAFPYRNWPYNLLVTSVWDNPAESEANIRWTRELWEAMQPFRADAVYMNYLGEEGEDRVRQAYGPNYDRLVALKNKYDPTNFFRLNQNIRPLVGESSTA